MMKRAIAVWGCLCIALLLMAVGCDDDDDDELVIVTESLPGGTVGVVYAFTLETEGDADEFFLVSGELPPGISLSDDGQLFGTPTLAGTFTFTIEVLDFARGFIDQRTSKGFVLIIQA